MPSPRLDQGPVVDLLNTLWADRSGVHDDLTDADPALRRLRDAVRVLAADRTADPRPVAAGSHARRVEAESTLNETASLAPAWPTLVDGRLVWASEVAGDERALGELAGEAVRFLADD